MIQIDADELIMAMEDQSSSWYMDKKTGDLMFDNDYLDDDMRQQMGADKFEEEPERFIQIERVPSYVGWGIMSDFVETIPQEDVANDLRHALEKRHPFRQFKDALHHYPDELSRWYIYHYERLKEIAQAWLEQEGLEVELTERGKPEKT